MQQYRRPFLLPALLLLLSIQVYSQNKLSRKDSIRNEKIEFENTLPVVGLGYRFALQPRINLRIDAGFGRDSFGFYLNITEAF